MGDHHTTLTAEALTVSCNTPFELLVQGNQIQGRTSSDDAAPALQLSGPLAARAADVTFSGQTRPLAAEQGTVKVNLPAGSTAFTIKLK